MTDAIPSPVLECDLVLKGGVTSGLVYPAAIAAIARDYRLRSIGGTSAGAIGAAAAASMEFGRRSGRNPAAAKAIASLAALLGETGSGGSPLLLHLFEPDPPTARLFRLAMRVREGGMTGMLWAILRAPLIAAFIVTAVVAAVPYLAMAAEPVPVRLSTAALVVLLGLPTLTGALAVPLWVARIRHDLGAVVANGFGLCSGMARHRQPSSWWRKPRAPTAAERPALAEWLHAQFQTLAGLEPHEVLTFGDLWLAADRSPGMTREQAVTAAIGRDAVIGRPPPRLAEHARDIDLALVASDINRGQSVQLPFMRREDRLYARLTDLRALFPPPVVEWMIAHPRLDDDDLATLVEDETARADFIRLPPPEDLPVLFAVRASLSVPLLFSAVRLHVVRRSAAAPDRQELAEIWLADGGITSNFPIHLFDAPMPARPTFCINLLYHDDELEPDAGTSPSETGLPIAPAAGGRDPGDLVYMLRTNSGRLSAYTRLSDGGGVQRLARFAGRVVATARQWGDNQLLDVPGYRDRIVHVRMRPDEGGFNFAMDAAKIADLEARGAWAGTAIGGRFRPDAASDPLQPAERLRLNWANHRMVRFRSFLAGLEVTVSRFTAGWTLDRERAEHPASDPQHASPSIEQMIDEARPGKDPFAQRVGYPFRSDAQADLAHEMVKALAALRAVADEPGWRGIDFHHGDATSPRPKPALRLRPPGATDVLAERP